MGAHRPWRRRQGGEFNLLPGTGPASQHSFPEGEAGSWDGGCIKKNQTSSGCRRSTNISSWNGETAIKLCSVWVCGDGPRLVWFGRSSQGILKYRFYLRCSSPGFPGVKMPFWICLDAAKVQEGDGRAGNQPCALTPESVLSQQCLSWSPLKRPSCLKHFYPFL